MLPLGPIGRASVSACYLEQNIVRCDADGESKVVKGLSIYIPELQQADLSNSLSKPS